MQTTAPQETQQRLEDMAIEEVAAAYVANTDAIASLNVFMSDFETRLQALTDERQALRREMYERTTWRRWRPDADRRARGIADAEQGNQTLADW